jgi:hypothetical protein
MKLGKEETKPTHDRNLDLLRINYEAINSYSVISINFLFCNSCNEHPSKVNLAN